MTALQLPLSTHLFQLFTISQLQFPCLPPCIIRILRTLVASLIQIIEARSKSHLRLHHHPLCRHLVLTHAPLPSLSRQTPRKSLLRRVFLNIPRRSTTIATIQITNTLLAVGSRSRRQRTVRHQFLLRWRAVPFLQVSMFTQAERALQLFCTTLTVGRDSSPAVSWTATAGTTYMIVLFPIYLSTTSTYELNLVC
jgi:hypothetical protein